MSTNSRARKSSPLYLPSAFDLFKPSKDLVLKHINVFGWLFLLPLLNLVGSWNTNPDVLEGRDHWQWQLNSQGGWNGLPFPSWGTFVGIVALWGVIWLALTIIVQIMSEKAQLDASETRTPSLAKSWQVVKDLGWRLLGLYIVVLLLFFVGLVLLIVPGLFILRRYIFAPYVMIERRCGIKEAMRRSHELGLKNTRAVWGIIGVMFLIMLVNVLPLVGGLASFVLASLYSVAPALRYQQLKKLP